MASLSLFPILIELAYPELAEVEDMDRRVTIVVNLIISIAIRYCNEKYRGCIIRGDGNGVGVVCSVGSWYFLGFVLIVIVVFRSLFVLHYMKVA